MAASEINNVVTPLGDIVKIKWFDHLFNYFKLLSLINKNWRITCQ